VGVKITQADDKKVKVSTDDTTPDFILNKLFSSDSSISFTETGGGGNETLDLKVNQAVVGHWDITGNSGTVAGTNFVGTTDFIDFVVKTDAVEVWRFGTTKATASQSLEFAVGNELRFLEQDGGGDYVGFKAPTSVVGSDPVFTLPGSFAAANNQAMTVDTSGIMSMNDLEVINTGLTATSVPFVGGSSTLAEDSLFTFDSTNNILTVPKIEGDSGFLQLTPDSNSVHTTGVRAVVVDANLNDLQGPGIAAGLAVMTTQAIEEDGTSGVPILVALSAGSTTNKWGLTNTSSNNLNAFLFQAVPTYISESGSSEGVVHGAVVDEPVFESVNASSDLDVLYLGFNSQPHFEASLSGTGGTSGESGGMVHFRAGIFSLEPGS
jgi:hypothetical protein